MKQFLESPALNGIGILIAIAVALLGESAWTPAAVIVILVLSVGALLRPNVIAWFSRLRRGWIFTLGLAFGLGIAIALAVTLWAFPDVFNASPSLSSVTSNGTPVEQAPYWLFAYSGSEETPPMGGFATLSMERDAAGKQYYRFKYDLPEDDTYGYTGIAFTYRTPQDITAYTHIEAQVSYDPASSACGLYLKDDDDEPEPPVLLGLAQTYEDTVDVAFEGQVKIVRLPLREYFPKVNLSQVIEIGFSASSEFAKGKGSCLVHGVLLITQPTPTS